MRGVSKIKSIALIMGVGAPLAVIPVAAAPAVAGTINNPLKVAGSVRCKLGSAESLLITGGGESHGTTVGPGGMFSIVFGNPNLPSTATAQVRCDIAGQRTYRSTNFLLYRPQGGQVLNVSLVA
ncbi:hypothetical protein FraEuI1c_2669 [Pseudofrankia inefficax]|uniref:Uncharacterized protein n=1 Tax=Pseudofrankia inefficax (strain DSM 45817 / CECT 9037 / DDB 130130 / EuI1c) TaxID=298654 RepID=E3J5A4_PSEI1|nr:hypothetical protein FraEuI1c_2669 [Pseudofrankia inefficax]